MRLRVSLVALGLSCAGIVLAVASCADKGVKPGPAGNGSTPDGSGGDAADGDDGGEDGGGPITYPCDAGRMLVMGGRTGHYIVNTPLVFTEADSLTFIATPNGVPTSVRMSGQKDGGGGYEVSLLNRNGGLVPGKYVDAGRDPFEDPGLSAHSPGRGCNTVTGFFEVHELTLTDDGGPDASVATFYATYEHHCEGSLPALTGCMRWTR